MLYPLSYGGVADRPRFWWTALVFDTLRNRAGRATPRAVPLRGSDSNSVMGPSDLSR